MFEISTGRQNAAYKVVIYGPEGIGKSTFAARFPDALFIDTEGSTKRMNVRRFPKPTSWEMLMNMIREAKNNKLCSTLIVDTIDWAEQLCIKAVCSKADKNGIEDFGYGNGYVYEKEEFARLLDLLEEVVEAGINVVLTAHAQMRKFSQPDEVGEYDRWELKLGKKTGSQISPLVKEWADMVLFANYRTVSVAVDKEAKKFKAQGGERVMYTAHHPCWDAKNRDGLPDQLPFDYNRIAHLFTAQPAPQAPTSQPVQQQPAPVPQQSAVQPVQQSAPQAVSEPEEKLNIPPEMPKALQDLMRADKVDESDIRLVVSQRGYFPQDTPLTNYPKDFVEGVLIAAWGQMLPLIRANQKVPFEDMSDGIPF